MMKVLAFDLDDTLISGWPPDDKRTKVADQLDKALGIEENLVDLITNGYN